MYKYAQVDPDYDPEAERKVEEERKRREEVEAERIEKDKYEKAVETEHRRLSVLEKEVSDTYFYYSMSLCLNEIAHTPKLDRGRTARTTPVAPCSISSPLLTIISTTPQ